jgi:hypothetical protein
VNVKFWARDLTFRKDKRGKTGTRTGRYRQMGREPTLASMTLRSIAPLVTHGRVFGARDRMTWRDRDRKL